MPLTSQSAGPKIDWLAEAEPDLYAQTAHLLTANGFAGCPPHRASCAPTTIRRPTSRRTTETGSWDRERDRLGVVDRLPALVWSDEVIGWVTRSAAALTGLPQGLPVVLGSSDGLTAAYGAGAVRARPAPS